MLLSVLARRDVSVHLKFLKFFFSVDVVSPCKPQYNVSSLGGGNSQTLACRHNGGSEGDLCTPAFGEEKIFLVGWFGGVLGIIAAWHCSYYPPQRPCQSPVSTNRSDNSCSDNHEIISQC